MVNIYSYPEELCIIFHIISLFMLPDHSTLGRLIYPLVIHLIRDIFFAHGKARGAAYLCNGHNGNESITGVHQNLF